MTYTTTVTVPRVTAEDIASLKALPGRLAQFVVAPVINDCHVAEAFARESLDAHLSLTSLSEYISGVQSYTYNDKEGWEFTFTIAGD